MSPRARRWTWIALVVLIVVVILLLLSRCSPRSPDPGADRAPGRGVDTSGTGHGLTFTVDGHTLRPISPGVSAPVHLVLTNVNDYPLVDTQLSITIRDVIAPHADRQHPCTVDDFTLAQSSARVVVDVPANGSTTLLSADIDPSYWPRVGMTNTASNQDGCKGATVRFHHTATGRRVDP